MIPLSSILGRNSFECGDIASLLPLGTWAVDAGFSILQILPLNDTGIDNSPYSAISSFAIDPIYISLFSMGSSLKPRKQTLVSNQINHKRIRELKLQELRRIYDSEPSKNKSIAKDFLSKNAWAYGYVAFRVLYDDYKGAIWTEWKPEHAESNKGKAYVFAERSDEAHFYAFIQSVAFLQLKKAKEDLEEIGVFLKGDMPILTSRNSSDVWENTEFFDLSLQAGAPPDDFSADGQNWGFPVLNWPNLRKNKFRWWKERLSYLENFFHLYRIDHVIGMYRIWAIPIQETKASKGWFSPQIGASRKDFEESGLKPEPFVELGLIYEFKEDHFIFFWDFWKSPAYQSLPEETKRVFFPLSNHNLALNEEVWRESGEEILDALNQFSAMIPCAEDLGAVPGFVRDSLKQRELLGIDVIRWTRSLEDGSYITPEGYRKTAISVLSTHDTSLALEWWQGLSGAEKHYSEEFFFTRQGLPVPANDEEISLGLLRFAFSANSLFSIQMLQDLLYKAQYGISKNPSEHRINLPGTNNDTNWTYRFSFHIEDLIEDRELSQTLRKMIIESERA
jgi:4-alpha-glucanotransferase